MGIHLQRALVYDPRQSKVILGWLHRPQHSPNDSEWKAIPWMKLIILLYFIFRINEDHKWTHYVAIPFVDSQWSMRWIHLIMGQQLNQTLASLFPFHNGNKIFILNYGEIQSRWLFLLPDEWKYPFSAILCWTSCSSQSAMHLLLECKGAEFNATEILLNSNDG